MTKSKFCKWCKLFDEIFILSDEVAAFVNKITLGEDLSQILMWLEFNRLSFVVHTNQPGMLRGSLTCHTQQCTKFCVDV
jgi:hypothetical protein